MTDLQKRIEEYRKRGFKEIGLPVEKVWDFEEKPEFHGIFLERRDRVGKNNSSFYVFEGDDNQRYGIWGSSILDTRLKNLREGEEVAIFYLGKTKSNTTGRTYKNFTVLHQYSEEAAGEKDNFEEIPISAYEEDLK